MLESKLNKKVYTFEKKFKYYHGELDNIEEYLNLKVELIIDLIKSEFYIDLNQPFNVETGILMMYGGNTIGNTYRKCLASAQFYKWLGDICDFAAMELDRIGTVYDPLEDEKVVEIARMYNAFMDKRLSLRDDTVGIIWEDFKRHLNPKKLGRKKSINRDSEAFDLDDNK